MKAPLAQHIAESLRLSGGTLYSSLRLSLRKFYWDPIGKPKAYRDVRRQSRLNDYGALARP